MSHTIKPKWAAPPGIGSKDRDSDWVAQCLEAVNAQLLVLPTAGLGKELCSYTGDADIVLADADPTIRAYWKGAANGHLTQAREQALRSWGKWLAYFIDARSKDPVLDAWKRITQAADMPSMGSIDRLAYAMMVMAGAHTGKRRRAKKTGQINISTVPKSRKTGARAADFLPSRIPNEMVLRRATEWIEARTVTVLDGFTAAFHFAAAQAGRRVFLVDPPYGTEKRAVYTSDWSNLKRDQLSAGLAAGLATQPSCAIVWCDADDYLVFRRDCPQLVWFLRPVKTAMRAKTATGPTRFGTGSYIGVSPAFAPFLSFLTPVTP